MIKNSICIMVLALPNMLLAQGTAWYEIQQDTYFFQQSKGWNLFSTDVEFIETGKAVVTVTFWKSKNILVRCIDGETTDKKESTCYQLDDDGEF